MRLIAGIATLPLLYVVYSIINGHKHLDTPFTYVLIVGFTSDIQSVNIIDSFFQAKVQGKYIMYVQVAGNIVSALIKLVFIILKLSLIWFVYSLLFDAVLIAVGYILIYRQTKNHLSNWKYNGQVAAYLFKHSWPLAFSAVLVSIYMKIDQAMIASYLDSKQLGIYSTVASLSESWYFIPVAIVTSVFPAIMNAKKTDLARYRLTFAEYV